MSERHSFFAELKRRNVYKVAIAYAVVSWLLIQGVVDFLSGLRSAAMDDQGIYCCHHPLLSDRARPFVGVRDYRGRNQA